MTISSPSVCARLYEVFKTEGKVCFLKDGKETAIVPRMGISYKDRFRIGKNSRIGIKDLSTKSIYYSAQYGECSVLDIIRDARNHSSACSAAARKILKEETQRKQARVLGVVDRGTGDLYPTDTNMQNEDIPLPETPEPDTFGWALQRIARAVDTVSESCPYPVALKVNISVPDSIVSYTIDYKGVKQDSEAVFVNVLRKDCQGHVDFMFLPDDIGGSLAIEPGTIHSIDWVPSVATPGDRYYLLVCSSNFSPEVAEHSSQRMQKSGNDEKIVRPNIFTPQTWAAPTWIIPASAPHHD